MQQPEQLRHREGRVASNRTGEILELASEALQLGEDEVRVDKRAEGGDEAALEERARHDGPLRELRNERLAQRGAQLLHADRDVDEHGTERRIREQWALE